MTGLPLHLISCLEALKNFQDRLTEFEQEEIMDYSEIWYLGLETKKIAGSQGAGQNSGYDDEQGNYIKVALMPSVIQSFYLLLS